MLSLTTAFIPQICFHVEVLCWSVVLCVAVVYVHMSTCIECTCLLCAACVGREKGTTNLKDVTCSTPSKIYTRDSPISLLFVVPFRGGRTVGRPVWEGAQQTHLGRNNAAICQEKLITDTIRAIDV